MYYIDISRYMLFWCLCHNDGPMVANLARKVYLDCIELVENCKRPRFNNFFSLK